MDQQSTGTKTKNKQTKTQQYIRITWKHHQLGHSSANTANNNSDKSTVSSLHNQPADKRQNSIMQNSTDSASTMWFYTQNDYNEAVLQNCTNRRCRQLYQC